MTAPASVVLRNNARLVNIQALLDNPGMGNGDVVNLEGTAVSCEDVTALRNLGVVVTSPCP